MKLKIYEIQVCAFGTFWERDVDCPSYWRGSGCYDVEYETIREGTMSVSAYSKERALKLVSLWFFREVPEWCETIQDVYYDPDTITEKEDEDDGCYEEVFDYDFEEAEVGADVPDAYSEELPSLTTDDKLWDLLDRLDNKARGCANAFKDDERKKAFYEGWSVLISEIRNKMRG